jgi:hypothetical protein
MGHNSNTTKPTELVTARKEDGLIVSKALKKKVSRSPVDITTAPLSPTEYRAVLIISKWRSRE